MKKENLFSLFMLAAYVKELYICIKVYLDFYDQVLMYHDSQKNRRNVTPVLV